MFYITCHFLANIPKHLYMHLPLPNKLYKIDGLGYHDDGDYDITGMAAKDEEYNNNQGGANNKKKKKNSNNALTKEVLRKARKNKASVKAAAGEEGSSPNKVSIRCHDSFFNFGRVFLLLLLLGGIVLGGIVSSLIWCNVVCFKTLSRYTQI